MPQHGQSVTRATRRKPSPTSLQIEVGAIRQGNQYRLLSLRPHSTARFDLQCIHTALRELAMNWDIVKGNWKQFRGRVQEQWGELTDDDLDRIEGKRDQLAGRLQEKYGITKDEANVRIIEWERGQRD
jgi:uncharacterized protein YjbJ (UPF0337 family)